MPFPVLYGENVPALYNVHSYPTTIFIDRAGNIKYRSSGLDSDNIKRSLEFIIAELIKSGS
jgi:thioredoxin-related protein